MGGYFQPVCNVRIIPAIFNNNCQGAPFCAPDACHRNLYINPLWVNNAYLGVFLIPKQKKGGRPGGCCRRGPGGYSASQFLFLSGIT